MWPDFLVPDPIAPEDEDCMCPSDDPDMPLDDECIPPDFIPSEPEDELLPMLLPVDLFCPGGDVWPTVPDAEVVGVPAFEGVVVKSLPLLAPDEEPGGV